MKAGCKNIQVALHEIRELKKLLGAVNDTEAVRQAVSMALLLQRLHASGHSHLDLRKAKLCRIETGRGLYPVPHYAIKS